MGVVGFISFHCRFTSTETFRPGRDGEPRTTTSTFTQLLTSDSGSVTRRRVASPPSIPPLKKRDEFGAGAVITAVTILLHHRAGSSFRVVCSIFTPHTFSSWSVPLVLLLENADKVTVLNVALSCSRRSNVAKVTQQKEKSPTETDRKTHTHTHGRGRRGCHSKHHFDSARLRTDEFFLMSAEDCRGRTLSDSQSCSTTSM